MMCLGVSGSPVGHLSDGHGRVGDIGQRKLGRLPLAELIGKDTGARVRSDTCGRICASPKALESHAYRCS